MAKCQSGHFSSAPFPSSCPPPARVKVTLMLGRRGQESSWQMHPRALHCPPAEAPLEEMGPMSSHGSRTFPLNRPATRKSCPVTTPGAQFISLGNRESASPSQRYGRFGGSRRKGSGVPWGPAASLKRLVTLPDNIEINVPQEGTRWLQAVQDLIGVAPSTSRVCKVGTEASPHP